MNLMQLSTYVFFAWRNFSLYYGYLYITASNMFVYNMSYVFLSLTHL